MIPFSDFQKVELRVGKIITAEPMEGSEKLLKLKVNLGVEIGEKQIIAGIGKNHEPEKLVGREIIIAANLEPRILMGLESQGMLLAASDESGPILITPDKEVPPGTKIR